EFLPAMPGAEMIDTPGMLVRQAGCRGIDGHAADGVADHGRAFGGKLIVGMRGHGPVSSGRGSSRADSASSRWKVNARAAPFIPTRPGRRMPGQRPGTVAIGVRTVYEWLLRGNARRVSSRCGMRAARADRKGREKGGD